jgi:hypothetical protein
VLAKAEYMLSEGLRNDDVADADDAGSASDSE